MRFNDFNKCVDLVQKNCGCDEFTATRTVSEITDILGVQPEETLDEVMEMLEELLESEE